MPVILGYWNLRGLAEYIRFLLEYTGTEYTDKLYEFGPAPDYSRAQWTDEKTTLGLEFPNLPYLIDGDTKLTQSFAIMRYLARKHNLGGQTPGEVIRADMLECEAMDMRMAYAMLCYNPDFENLKKKHISESVPAKLKPLSKSLGKQKWFLGDRITYVDFLLYEALSANRGLDSSILDKTENLKEFMTRFESLERIKKYMNSGRFNKDRFNAPFAFFGGK